MSIFNLTSKTSSAIFPSMVEMVPPDTKKDMYYTVWKSTANSQWYWNLKAANHEKIAQSEGYSSKENALNAIALLKASSNAPIIEK